MASPAAPAVNTASQNEATCSADAAISDSIDQPVIVDDEAAASVAQFERASGKRVRWAPDVEPEATTVQPLADGVAPPPPAKRPRIDDAGEDFLAPILGVADTTPARHSCLQSLLRSPRSLQLH